MKKEELFELLGEVDERFIDEAMLDGFDSERPVKVRAGKTSVLPLKIVAGAAACLAVFAAAGLLWNNRGKFVITPAETSNSESAANSETTSNKTAQAGSEFVEECKTAVMKDHPLLTVNTWSTRIMDIDCDGEDELLLYPEQFNGNLIGVRVFKNTDKGVRDLGVFGEKVTDLDLDKIFKSPKEGDNNFYYSGSETAINFDDPSTYIIYTVSYSERTKKVSETEYLRYEYVSVNDVKKSERAFRCGEEISMEELLNNWAQFPNIETIDDTVYDRITLPSMLDILSKKYGVSDIEKYKREAMTIDFDNDGKPETATAFQNCEQLNGIYVFDVKDGEVKLIGELETDPGSATELYDNFLRYANGSENFFVYNTRTKTTEYIKKIAMGSDGMLSAETLLSVTDDGINAPQYKIGDRAVSEVEYNAERAKYFPNGE